MGLVCGAATCLLYIPGPGIDVPIVEDQPAQRDAAESMKNLVDELFCDFPFDDESDCANAIGCLLTPLVRPAISGVVPMALLDSPEPGTGKGLLADVVCAVATGHPAAKKPLPDSAEEIRKTITSTLMAGSTVIVLDNVDGAIRSAGLAAALTADVWGDRILGRSQNVNVPNRATWIATGNNLTVAGDLARRCYRIRLDARQARPYTRTGFRHADLLGWTLEHRAELVATLLTCARAWWVAGRPRADVPTMGGFTAWAENVGGILAFAGIGGFLGNLKSFFEAADEEASEWESFLLAWRSCFGDEIVTVAEVVREIESWTSALSDALPVDLADAASKSSFNKIVGQSLAKRGGRHYGDEGLHLSRHRSDRRDVVRWSVAARGSLAEDNPRKAAAKVTPLRATRRRRSAG